MDLKCNFCGTEHKDVPEIPGTKTTCMCGKDLTGIFSVNPNKLVEDVSRAFRRSLLRSFSSQDLLEEVMTRLDDEMKDKEEVKESEDFTLTLREKIDADLVFSRMLDILNEFGFLSKGDVNDLMGFSSTPTHHRMGWIDLMGVSVQPYNGNYVIRLPKPRAYT